MKELFKTGTPESAGIPSDAIEWLLDQLESGFTEPHGIMIMRNDILCAQGWWAPFAPGICHGEQSHSKTYAATAIGIAYTQGLLSLNEKLIDIFPEQIPDEPSDYLRELSIHDVLCMGSGMLKEPTPSANWIRDFLSVPIVHSPGTSFMYNSTGSSVLAAIIKRKTGKGLHVFLEENLYKKIGIRGENHKWALTADGIEIGGAGLFATLEDNFRLMRLYMNGGKWNGEQILSEEYVKAAISKQIDTKSEAKVNPPATDNFLGYGYQIWQCQPKGAYRADGAMGQFTVVIPSKNMEIAIMENAAGAHWAQKSLDLLWEFLDKIPETDKIEENPEKANRLRERLQRLSLPAPKFQPNGKSEKILYGKTIYFENPLWIDAYGLLKSTSSAIQVQEKEITKILIEPANSMNLRIKIQGSQIPETEILASLDGTWKENNIDVGLLNRLLVSAYWECDTCLVVSMRWIETCGMEQLKINVGENNITADLIGTLAQHDDQIGVVGVYCC